MKNSFIKLICFVGLLAIGANAIAQQAEGEALVIPLSEPGASGMLNVHVLYGSIRVTAYNGQEVIISSKQNEEKQKVKYKDGLRKISSGSSQYRVEEYNNTVSVHSGHGNKLVDFDIKVPKNFSLELKATNSGDIYVEGVHGEMEISNTNGAITLKNIAGAVIADALNKDIVVNFTEVTSNAAMAFTSLNGDLNISFPSNLKASIKAKTEYGDIYTDFEIAMQQSSAATNKRNDSGVYKVTVDEWLTGTINGGGQEILFKTLNGDIMIREQ